MEKVFTTQHFYLIAKLVDDMGASTRHWLYEYRDPDEAIDKYKKYSGDASLYTNDRAFIETNKVGTYAATKQEARKNIGGEFYIGKNFIYLDSMTQEEEIIEGSKRIAEYMGLFVKGGKKWNRFFEWVNGESIEVFPNYLKSWNRQQPVWKKVNEEASGIFLNIIQETGNPHTPLRDKWATIRRNYIHAFTTGTPETAFPYLLEAVDWVQEQKRKEVFVDNYYPEKPQLLKEEKFKK